MTEESEGKRIAFVDEISERSLPDNVLSRIAALEAEVVELRSRTETVERDVIAVRIEGR